MIPAIPFYRLVLHFAEANALEFFTIKQQKAAIKVYCAYASKLN